MRKDSLGREALDEDQERAVDFGKSNKKAAFWMDMGAGKTLATLTLMAELVESFEVERILVVSTLLVVTETWPRELEKWSHLTSLDYSVLRSPDKAARKALYRNTSTVHLINIEMLHTLLDEYKDDLPYDMLVIDESSLFKDRTAKTRFKKLKRYVDKFDRTIELTASPASKDYMALWPQVYLLDKGARLGQTFTKFKSRYLDQGYAVYDLSLRDGADKEIQKKIRDIVLRIERPPATDVSKSIRYSPLPKEAQIIHDQLVKDLVVVLEGGSGEVAKAKEASCIEDMSAEDDYVEAETAAVLTSKIRQVCNGSVYTKDLAMGDSKERKVAFIHDNKVQQLKQIALESQSNLFVIYQFKSDVEQIKKHFPQAKTVRELDCVEEEWNSGKVPILLAHPKSASHGLNLQYGGHVIVFFGVECSGELETQIIGRLARRGQKRKVSVVYLFSEGTREKRLYDSVQAGLEGERMLLKSMLD